MLPDITSITMMSALSCTPSSTGAQVPLGSVADSQVSSATQLLSAVACAAVWQRRQLAARICATSGSKPGLSDPPGAQAAAVTTMAMIGIDLMASSQVVVGLE